MPEGSLADAVRARLEPENAESISQLSDCCTLRPDEVQQRLLCDIRNLGLPKGTVRIGSCYLIQLLQAAPASPWRDLTPHKLARMLGSFDVHPCAIRFRRQILRGYDYSELRGAFAMYLPTATSV